MQSTKLGGIKIVPAHRRWLWICLVQPEGIAKAKAEGKYKGRTPTARAKTDEVLALKAKGIGPSAIARELEISRSSVHRILRV